MLPRIDRLCVCVSRILIFRQDVSLLVVVLGTLQGQGGERHEGQGDGAFTTGDEHGSHGVDLVLGLPLDARHHKAVEE